MHVIDPELQERRTPMPIPGSHFVNGTELKPPFPAGLDGITTEIELASPFYYAEEKHQQYLAKYQGG